MAAVKALVPGPVAFRGLGGRAMAAQGLDSLFPLHDIAVNGFSAILARVPHLLRRIREAVDAVIAAKPDVLVIIDSPGFTHRVAPQVRMRAPHIPIVDYVSPQMWAWRPGRAVTMRAYVDHVLALWPFEPEAYRRLGGPPCTFVGHPLAEEVATLRPGPAEAVRRTANPPLLLMLPGSRGGEVGRHLAVFGAAASPTFPTHEKKLIESTATSRKSPLHLLGHSAAHRLLCWRGDARWRLGWQIKLQVLHEKLLVGVEFGVAA
jgi:lipid-A-disaccharide synthase